MMMESRIMKIVMSFICAYGLWAGAALAGSVPKIIFDSDMYTDIDDVGALAMLHALADAGECEILGTVSSVHGAAPSTGMIELINNYYGRGDLPLGAAKATPDCRGMGPDVDPGAKKNICYRIYCDMVAAHAELKHQTCASAPDAVEVYRRLLAAAEDGSVTIVTVGFTTNVRRLLESKGDEFSPLDGRALVARKVASWVAMACRYPEGREYNAKSDGESSRRAFEGFPRPVYFADSILGSRVRTGLPVSRLTMRDNPVRDVFARAFREFRKTDRGHPAFDELAVLCAVRGRERYFGVERGRFDIRVAGGNCGENKWTKDDKGSHYVLTAKMSYDDIAKVIDELMVRAPRCRGGAERLDAGTMEGFRLVFDRYFCEKTSLIYSCPPDQVQKSDFFPNGLRVWRKDGDYGVGMEDCAILHGVALSGLCDEFDVTHRTSAREDAGKLVEGLLRLVNGHPYRGYVVRGICAEDGRGVCALTSRDQVTHWVHGLWRYRRSALYDSRFEPTLRTAFNDVAERMLRTVVATNDWCFGQADGSVDPRGITRMRHVDPHEAARLAMVYAAAWDVTHEDRWRTAWRSLAEEAARESLRLRTMNPSWLEKLMNYALLQMNTSLEVLRTLEPDSVLRTSFEKAMQDAAQTAAEHAVRIGAGDGPFLCSCGELALARLMAPGADMTDELRASVEAAIDARPLNDPETGSIRILHLYAAWWRLRRRNAR